MFPDSNTSPHNYGVSISNTDDAYKLNYGIAFQVIGRGNAYFDYDKVEETEYGGRKASNDTAFLKGIPEFGVIKFEDNKDDPFYSITIDYQNLPPNFWEISSKLLTRYYLPLNSITNRIFAFTPVCLLHLINILI